MNSRRTFIAVDLHPDPIFHEMVQRLKHELRDDSIRWLPSWQYHLTLRFIGQTSSSQIEAIAAHLALVASTTRPFEVELSGLHFFGASYAPKILWSEVKTPAAVSDLSGQIGKFCDSMGLFPEKIPFRPHLTLGRIRSLASLDKFMEVLNHYEKISFGKETVREIVFYESLLEPAGAVYLPIEKYALRGSD